MKGIHSLLFLSATQHTAVLALSPGQLCIGFLVDAITICKGKIAGLSGTSTLSRERKLGLPYNRYSDLSSILREDSTPKFKFGQVDSSNEGKKRRDK